MQTEASKTWMLFESGGAVVVDLSLHMAARGNRPIDAYIVTGQEGGAFAGAARRAAEAAYHATLPFCPETSAMVVAYDLHGLSAGCPVTGESGGLAFALALGKRLLKKDPGPVAATGAVQSGHSNGPIGAVLGIDAKLSAAGELLPENGWVLYPRANESDVSAELKASLEKKGLHLHSVSTVAEAFQIVFGLPPQTVSSKKQWLGWLGGVLLLVLGSVAGVVIWTQSKPIPPVVTPVVQIIKQPMLPVKKIIPKQIPVKVSETVMPDQGGEVPKEVVTKSPEKASRFDMPVHLMGKTTLEKRLADILSMALGNVLEKQSGLPKGTVEVKGRVKIVKIEEFTEAESGAFKARMIVETTKLRLKKATGKMRVPTTRTEIEGPGSVTDLLPLAARKLADVVMEAMRIKTEYRPLSSEKTTATVIPVGDSKGFE